MTDILSSKAMKAPKSMTEKPTIASTKPTCRPALAAANPPSIPATKVTGHAIVAVLPTSTLHNPASAIAARWSAPPNGCARPATNEPVDPAGCAKAGVARTPNRTTRNEKRRIFPLLSNGTVHRDELCPVRKCGFNLNLANHLRNAVHDMIASENPPALGNELGNRLSITSALHDGIGDQRDAFGIIELQAPREPASRNHRCEGDHQLVSFTRCKIHVFLRPFGRASMTTS